MQPRLELYPSFNTQMLRAFPRMLGSGFLIVLIGSLLHRWIYDRPIAFGKSVLFSLAVALFFTGLSAGPHGYYFRRAGRIPRRSSVTRRMIGFSFLWSLVLSSFGFFLLGCSIWDSCTSWSDVQMAVVIALIASTLVSFIVLSS